MTTYRSRPKALRFAAASAIAALALSGCAGGFKLSRSEAPAGKVSKAAIDSERAVIRAETAVAKNPQNAALRFELGQAYLADGRFASASTAFDDAIYLGDNSARTGLSLALARIGTGQSREALALLDQHRGSIPASDMGLAVALAGETNRGVALLADALRGGENTPKLRQNLAYAYALDGRWAEARTMMAMDVPANQLDERISEWALRAKPDDHQERVAGLLGAPVRGDPGQPVQLALGNRPTVEQLAAEAAAPAPALAANTELPAMAEAPVPAAAFVPAEPAAAPVEPAAAPVVQTKFADSFTASPPAAPVQARQRPVRAVRIALPAAKPTAPQVAASNGSHLVQLGSFSSQQNARRAWDLLVIRNPNLRNHRMVITQAVVHGKNFWRVAAAGYNADSASGACASVKNRGGACFAYAATRAPAGLAHAAPGKAIASRR